MEAFFTIDDESMFECLGSASTMIETTRGLIFDIRPSNSSGKTDKSDNKFILNNGEVILHTFKKINELKYGQLGELYLTNYKVRSITIVNTLDIFHWEV